ncbi:MAG TPA: ATP-dependent 6-phosphofructokinase, partial [Polyangia bacterium]
GALGLEVVGVEDGYEGLIAGRLAPLDVRALDDAARRGGTLLGTARSSAFRTEEGRARARATIERERLRALVVVGGNGSLTGAQLLDGVLRVGGVPASIDNDLGSTSMCIGVDTALNTIVEACDRINDTATAHRRTFVVEVMGRDCGYLAMTAAIAAGADAVLLREVGRSEAEVVEQVVRAMELAYARDSGKRRVLVVKSEGVKVDPARLKAAVDERVRAGLALGPSGATGGQERSEAMIDTRVTVLGHVVRGGAPTAFDRLLAARLANATVRALADGRSGFMAGWCGPGVTGEVCAYDPYVVLTPIKEVLRETELLMCGESPLAKWRRRTFEEAESILLK